MKLENGAAGHGGKISLHLSNQPPIEDGGVHSTLVHEIVHANHCEKHADQGIPQPDDTPAEHAVADQIAHDIAVQHECADKCDGFWLKYKTCKIAKKDKVFKKYGEPGW